MRLNINSFTFNIKQETPGGTPSWGTALGQGEGYKIKPEFESLVTSLLMVSVKDKDSVQCRLGQDNNGIETGLYDVLMLGLYSDVYFNDVKIDDAKYTLMVVREHSQSHDGRKLLKYNVDMKYGGNEYNKQCIEKIRQKFAIGSNGAFFVYEIDVKNQTDLHLRGVILDKNNVVTYTDAAHKKLGLTSAVEESRRNLNVEDATGLSGQKIIERISNYIKYKGFSYSDKLIENFYLSLKSKPFVILAGISGTGKTRLVKLFAEAIDAGYKLISVRPDWSDSSDLFGHLDLGNHFICGPMTEAIWEANENPQRPYFVCLDEMNLARVEHYLSDFLSNIETRRLNNDHITTETPIFVIPKHNDEDGNVIEEERLMLPENLYVVGTVNMDETTFPFSKKVLDRANTIEFSEVNFKEQPSSSVAALTGVNNTFLKSNYCNLLEARAVDNDFVKKISNELTEINKKLAEANLQIGYRVRDEICYYMLNNFKDATGTEVHLMNDYEAFAYELLQKILPRIQGSGDRIKGILEYLLNYDFGVFNEQGYENSDVVKKYSAKIKMMLSRLESDDYTSYWL